MIKKIAVYIQVFLFQIINTFLTIIKILVLSDLSVGKIKKEKEKNDCIILGNGPSLNDFLNNNSDFISKNDLIAVNHFADTEYYEKLKPMHYFLNAPELWTDNVEQSHIDRSIKLFSNLSNKTDWKLNLYLHPSAKKSKIWQNIIKKNQYISIQYYNPCPIDGFESFRYFCYKNNLGMPRPHNVLIPSLLFAVNNGYRNIYISGADHSWLKDIWVSDDNRVLLTQRHFYDEKTAKAEPMHKEGKGERKMHEVLEKMVYAFRSYFEIDKYGKKKNSRIFNLTKDSYIDAFERIKNYS